MDIIETPRLGGFLFELFLLYFKWMKEFREILDEIKESTYRAEEQSTNVVRTKSAEYVYAKMIEDILDNFDFEKCHFVMTALKWQWHGTRIPTVDQLRCSARQRLETAIKGAIDKKDILPLNSCYYSSSGGLKATAWRNRYGHLESARLEFVIAEWDSDGDYIRNEK